MFNSPFSSFFPYSKTKKRILPNFGWWKIPSKRCHLWKPMFYCNWSLHFQSIYTYYTHILFRILRTSFESWWFLNEQRGVCPLTVRDFFGKKTRIWRTMPWSFRTSCVPWIEFSPLKFQHIPWKQWLGVGFKYFFMFTPICGRFPIWLILFIWVETTNQMTISIPRHACFGLFT